MRKFISSQANKPWFHKPMVAVVFWLNKRPSYWNKFSPARWLSVAIDEVRVFLQWL